MPKECYITIPKSIFPAGTSQTLNLNGILNIEQDINLYQKIYLSVDRFVASTATYKTDPILTLSTSGLVNSNVYNSDSLYNSNYLEVIQGQYKTLMAANTYTTQWDFSGGSYKEISKSSLSNMALTLSCQTMGNNELNYSIVLKLKFE